ncbi:hypothetical protein ABTM80_18945, partial [Acinetobacter baumannii]
MIQTSSFFRILLLACGVGSTIRAAADPAAPGGMPLPPFTHQEPADWLNSAPLSVEQLRGSVVLIDFWALDCWNCDRTIPWLNEL